MGNSQILGIIGARSGSTGVPDKNIKPLGGVPLIGRIIRKARESRYLGRVLVSTDSRRYAEIARSFGADAPFLRPSHLAEDRSSEIEYVKHALAWLERNENYEPDIVVRMMATVPLQTTSDIDACIDVLLADPAADSAVVIAEARQHPEKALKLVDDGRGGKKLVTYFEDSGREVTPIARQSYENAYFRANIIACRRETITTTDSLTGDLVRYYVIPQERAIDIDTPMDFFVAEQLLKHLEEEPQV